MNKQILIFLTLLCFAYPFAAVSGESNRFFVGVSFDLSTEYQKDELLCTIDNPYFRYYTLRW